MVKKPFRIPIPSTKMNRNDLRKDSLLVKQLRLAAEQSSGDDGWAYMGQVAKYISNNSSFSPLNYGYAKLSDLIKASELFEIDMRSNGSAMYIKDARKYSSDFMSAICCYAILAEHRQKLFVFH